MENESHMGNILNIFFCLFFKLKELTSVDWCWKFNDFLIKLFIIMIRTFCWLVRFLRKFGIRVGICCFN